jgi:hypothetical protein
MTFDKTRKVGPELLVTLPTSNILETVNFLILSGSLVDDVFFRTLVEPRNK